MIETYSYDQSNKILNYKQNFIPWAMNMYKIVNSLDKVPWNLLVRFYQIYIEPTVRELTIYSNCYNAIWSLLSMDAMLIYCKNQPTDIFKFSTG